MTETPREISAQRLETDIQMLREWVNTDEIESLIDALEALRRDPQNETLLSQVKQTYSELGFIQGAVLTYATYLKALLSDDAFGDLQEELLDADSSSDP